MTEVECKTELELPPIHVTMDEMHRLSALANSSLALFPRAAHFLAREMDRARVVSDDTELRSVVRMGCQVAIATRGPATCGRWSWSIRTKPTFRSGGSRSSRRSAPR